jgi:DNA-directed RNA polymerase subunit RPC12/RpoP
MFKEKSSKKKVTADINETVTLDAMHNNMIRDFEKSDKEKLYYENKLRYCEEHKNDILNTIKNTSDKETSSKLWFSNIELCEEILDIKSKLYELNKLDEIEYYKSTSDILFQYYDTVNKQSDINQNSNYLKDFNNKSKIYKKDSKKNKGVVANTINVLEALNNIDNKKPIVEKFAVNDSEDDIKCENLETLDEYNNDNKMEIVQDKSSLVDKYMAIINNKYIRTVEEENIEICKICKNNMVSLQYDAIIVCNYCGFQELLLVEQNRPILKQNTKDTSHFCYKRINHFREWCNQVQGKESTDIPDEIFEKILMEIKKDKITDLKKITYLKMRDILKRLRINKYYEHINYIINRINGIPTPQFSPELEDKLCNMFRSIQAPFLKHCPKDRKNFLSYSYVLYKFFQILGLNEYLKYFPLLKSREKLYVQDQIWKKICIDLNYEIIPSL